MGWKEHWYPPASRTETVLCRDWQCCSGYFSQKYRRNNDFPIHYCLMQTIEQVPPPYHFHIHYRQPWLYCRLRATIVKHIPSTRNHLLSYIRSTSDESNFFLSLHSTRSLFVLSHPSTTGKMTPELKQDYKIVTTWIGKRSHQHTSPNILSCYPRRNIDSLQEDPWFLIHTGRPHRFYSLNSEQISTGKRELFTVLLKYLRSCVFQSWNMVNKFPTSINT